MAFGIAPILDGIDFNIEQGERVCLIGRNGEGKSTLFKVISGQVKADSGEFQISGNLKIAMLEQDIPETSGKVSDIVMAGAGDVATWLTAYEQTSDKCASGDMKACELMSDLQHKIDDAHGGLDPRSTDHAVAWWTWTATPILVNYRAVANAVCCFARALITKPDVLLLTSRPTIWMSKVSNGLSNFCKTQGLTLLFISHDRSFIDKIATRIVELDRGILRSYDVTKQAGNVNKGYARYQELKEQQLSAEKSQCQFW